MPGRYIVLLRALVLVVVTGRCAVDAVAGQGPSRAARRSPTPVAKNTRTPPLTPDGQPDLQGVWINNSATPLERPKALEGRSLLTDAEVIELRARAARLIDNGNGDGLLGDQLFLAALANPERYKNPNSTGAYSQLIEREFDNRTSLITDPPDGKIPLLTKAGRSRTSAVASRSFLLPWQPGMDQAEEQKQAAAWAARRRRPEGPADLTGATRCITWGIPRLGVNSSYTSHSQIFQAPGYVALLSEVNHEIRIIPLDGRPHFPESVRQWNGDSRGRWEGNTLVVETRNFSPASYFMGSAENLHLIERFTRVATDTINYEITLDDPTTWTKPWTALVRLKQTQDKMYEYACHEGNYYTMSGVLGGARAEEKAIEEAAKRPK
jgi:hypothetical protein